MVELFRTAIAFLTGFSVADNIYWLLNKKKPDEVCSDPLEECFRTIRSTIEASITTRTLNDEKLLSHVNKCLTDIEKLIEKNDE